jgi:hypothetical protein
LNPAIRIREVRAGDGAGCARAWSDAGRYIKTVDPVLGHVPDSAGLADWFEAAATAARPAAELWLVAECNGEVAGFVQAAILPPDPNARW